MRDIRAELSQNVLSRFYITGEWVQSHSDQRIAVINPATEEVLFEVPLADQIDVDRAIAAARVAFDTGPWSRMTGPERSEIMARFVDLLAKRAELLGRLWTAQVGAPISFASSAFDVNPSASPRSFHRGTRRSPSWPTSWEPLSPPAVPVS